MMHAMWYASGKVFIYGGQYKDTNVRDGEHLYTNLDDLWSYEPQINRWTLISGDNSGSHAMTLSYPGSRSGSSFASDSFGRLYIFGGTVSIEDEPSGSMDSARPLNDLWSYDITLGSWTNLFVGSPTSVGSFYGLKGTESPQNYPGTRLGSTMWVYQGYVYLFAGTSETTYQPLSDLWRFNVANGQWAWVSGENKDASNGTMTTQFDVTNTPRARSEITAVRGAGSIVYIFGGTYRASVMGDLIAVDCSSMTWQLVSGSPDVNQPNRTSSSPTARGIYAMSYSSISKRLLIYGGDGFWGNSQRWFNAPLGDLWLYQMGNVTTPSTPSTTTVTSSTRSSTVTTSLSSTRMSSTVASSTSTRSGVGSSIATTMSTSTRSSSMSTSSDLSTSSQSTSTPSSLDSSGSINSQSSQSSQKSQRSSSTQDDPNNILIASSSSPSSSSMIVYVVPPVVGGLLIAVIIVFVIIAIIRRRKSGENSVELRPMSDVELNVPVIVSPAPTEQLYTSLSPSQRQSHFQVENQVENRPSYDLKDIDKIPAAEIVAGRSIGEGSFGVVYQGDWRGTTVAMKSLKKTQIESLISEAQFMRHLNHPNVIRMFGVSEIKDQIFLVTEFCVNGSLTDYFLSRKLNTTDRVRMAIEIASGMCYLHSKKIIHRDLAIRNVLVTGDPAFKVADFGLSKVSNNSYYSVTGDGEKAFPIRWTAMEVFTHLRFSTASDVWSFGVVMWEIWEDGKVPYFSMSNKEVMENVVNGHRLSKPKLMSDDLWQIASSCFESDVASRPSMEEISSQLRNFSEKDQYSVPIKIQDSQPIYMSGVQPASESFYTKSPQ
eukprot:TRINITY_DN631_c1_g1_i1.p1 TRINITY_DN631_c1_g1~~TRINITY_DN631_c1_g1_i1.p1  ORF type:complete len:962 (+),score=186.76 TRINITY_DN631_c1_g1_i1:414-2888(+)